MQNQIETTPLPSASTSPSTSVSTATSSPPPIVVDEPGDFASEVCACLVVFRNEPPAGSSAEEGRQSHNNNRQSNHTHNEEPNDRFMAFLAPNHDVAWNFLKNKPTGGFGVLVLDDSGQGSTSNSNHQHSAGLYLDTRVCETSYCFRLLDKKALQENQISLEDAANKGRTTRQSSHSLAKSVRSIRSMRSMREGNNQEEEVLRMKRPVLVMGNHHAFKRLEQLWKEYMLYFETFAYDMHRIELFEIESDKVSNQSWINKILAMNARAMTDRSALLDDIPNDQIPTIHVQMLMVKSENPHCCVVNMIKKASDHSSRHASVCCWGRRDSTRLSLRIMEFDFQKLCIVITDTFVRQPSLLPFKAFMEKQMVYQLDIALVSFFEVYQSFASPKQMALKSLFLRSTTARKSTRSNLSSSSQSLRSMRLDKSLPGNSGGAQDFPTEDLALRACFSTCLDEFDLVIKSKEIHGSLKKELLQLLEHLYRIRGRKMRFSLETNLVRTRLVHFLLEFLAASNEDTPVKKQIKHLRPIQKVLRLAVLLLTTKTAEKCFFVAFHAINKVFALLFDSRRQICAQIWFLLMEMIEHDRLYRDLVIDKAREMFMTTVSHRPKCVYMYFQPSLVQTFILQHMDQSQSVFVERNGSITSISEVVASNSSLVSNEQFAGQMGDVLGYELIVRLAKVLLIDVTNMVGIERNAAAIVSYPRIYDNLFERILHWTLELPINTDVASKVLSILWQSVSLLQQLEPHAKLPTPKQIVFMTSFNEHLRTLATRANSTDIVLILSPRESAILGIIAEYVRRGNSLRIDEFILVCMEEMVGLMTEFVKSAGRNAEAEHGEAASVLIDVWRILLEKTRTRALRELLLRYVEEEELCVFQLFEVLCRCLEDQDAWGVAVRRMTLFAETLVRLSRGETFVQSSLDDPGIKPRDYEVSTQKKAAELTSRILPQPLRTHGRTFWFLIVEFMLKITSMPGVWKKEHLTLVHLFVRIYGVRQMVNAFPLETREKFIRFHLDKIEPAALWKQETKTVELGHAMTLHAKGLIVLATNPHNLEAFVKLNALTKLLNELPFFTNAKRTSLLSPTHGGVHLPPLMSFRQNESSHSNNHPEALGTAARDSPLPANDSSPSKAINNDGQPELQHPNALRDSLPPGTSVQGETKAPLSSEHDMLVTSHSLGTLEKDSCNVSSQDCIKQVHAFVAILIMLLASAGSPTLELDDNFCSRFGIDKGELSPLAFLQQQLTTFLVVEKQNGVSSFAQAMTDLKKNRLLETSRSEKLLNLWRALSTK